MSTGPEYIELGGVKDDLAWLDLSEDAAADGTLTVDESELSRPNSKDCRPGKTAASLYMLRAGRCDTTKTAHTLTWQVP